MKKLVVMLVMVPSAASAADIVTLKNGMTFNHKSHQGERVGKCFVCHDNISVSEDGKKVTTEQPGKIKGFGKAWAHEYCKDCHELFGEGPVSCSGCHKK